MLGLAVLLGAALPPVPTPVGIGPRFQLPPASAAVSRGVAVGRLRCEGRPRVRALAHVELFADRRVLVLPAGIGVGGKRCSYAVRTTAPTGVVEFVPSAKPTLGDLFAVWEQPLSRARLAGFRGRVRVFVRGREWRGDPRAVLLRPHLQITAEVGGYVRPHGFFLFPARATA
jgi:hypothetical protein